MPIFSCTKCDKEFNRKSNYDYHINNMKRPCNIIKSENNEENEENLIIDVEPPIISPK